MATVGERYELLELLGEGGMASVHRARDLRLLRDVAVKLIGGIGRTELSTRCFHREARAIAQLQHPHIVQVFDYSGDGDHQPYIVMELVRGIDLGKAMRRRHPVPEAVLLTVASRVGAALAHAHGRGLVHRDIKPTNVLIETETGRLLLSDFGLAKAFEDGALPGASGATSSILVGTPRYMAPEQIEKRESGPHSDVFSLGTMLYELAADRHPFEHESMHHIMRRIVDGDYDAIQDHRSDLSAPVADLIDACLQADPGRRPTAKAVAVTAAEHLSDWGVLDLEETVRAFVQTEALPVASPALVAPKPVIWAPAQKRRGARRGFVVGLLGAAVAGVAALVLPYRIEAPPPASDTAAPSPPPSSAVTESSPPQPARAASHRRDKPPPLPTSAPSPPPAPAPATPKPVAEVGMLHIVVAPWGQVRIDGQFRGNTPLLNRVSLSPGRHHVEISHPALGTQNHDVQIAAGEAATLDVHFDDPAN